MNSNNHPEITMKSPRNLPFFPVKSRFFGSNRSPPACWALAPVPPGGSRPHSPVPSTRYPRCGSLQRPERPERWYPGCCCWSKVLEMDYNRKPPYIYYVGFLKQGYPKSFKSLAHLVLKPMVTWGTPTLGNLHIYNIMIDVTNVSNHLQLASPTFWCGSSTIGRRIWMGGMSFSAKPRGGKPIWLVVHLPTPLKNDGVSSSVGMDGNSQLNGKS